ncbi:hypothetical protein SDRG_10385 [Saprolegnia diclina VS20]|uniref:Uncharacterized protein n=1 Tax=Saprolegnia diclina (strain VS20) TaxID=1156394 RepID=T0QB28_SAPDV|nr:hypothetical protein SDRG_10385 [Saprolegnia diclina VS20]EQC31866.1 hypothetical protein SDRG_10385 [Saprolegnia diclina VS20]|eukprot:XP_008614594.1 hypothetical protein SDRG_10385 [Saprolegnia diclina VS20]
MSSSVERSRFSQGLCEKLVHLALDALDLESVSDESDGVRDVAMHAGSIVANAHALSSTKDNLPALEAGIFDDNWRLRQSSISLLGDLVYCVITQVGPIIPRASLDPMNPVSMRRGYCLGLVEVVQCSPKKQLEDSSTGLSWRSKALYATRCPRALKVKSRHVPPYLAQRQRP